METWSATVKLKISTIRKCTFFLQSLKILRLRMAPSNTEVGKLGSFSRGPSATQVAMGKTGIRATLKMPNSPL